MAAFATATLDVRSVCVRVCVCSLCDRPQDGIAAEGISVSAVPPADGCRDDPLRRIPSVASTALKSNVTLMKRGGVGVPTPAEAGQQPCSPDPFRRSVMGEGTGDILDIWSRLPLFSRSN